MGTILSLAIHNHQPVGNFPHVFETAYAQSYLPMVRALDRHPAVRVALHYSGPLLDWIEDAHPEFIPMLRALVARGQVEMMTGGYYEPILAVIPERDRAGQIRKMTTYLQRRLGARPAGLWLAERVWEPHLPRSLAAAGVEYTIVDDAHFLAAGVGVGELTGHFVTEEEGATLSVLPSLRELRYIIPWKPVADVLAFLRAHAAEPSPVLLMGDDGEKFGMWPTTYAHCWERGWVEEFFTALEGAADWLIVAPPGETLRRPAAGRVYLPTASYEEMEEWALPAGAGAEYAAARRTLEERGDPAARFLRGGYWRQFLVKYPEINTMHKKMLRTSDKVWRLPPGRRRQRALEALWQGQCNCPYWHGVFGGAYLPHIRRANFAHLIAAEALADEAGAVPHRASRADLDADGAAEIELASPAMVLWIDPQEGGGVVAWDWRGARINLVNVLTRRREAYHRQLLDAPANGPEALETIHTARVRVKEEGLARLLGVDAYRRASFLDHLLPSVEAIDPVLSGARPSRFATAAYEMRAARSGGGAFAVGTCEGGTADGRGVLRVRKRFEVIGPEAVLRVAYDVVNIGDDALHCAFGVETNWAITDPNAEVRLDGEPHPARLPRAARAASRIELTDFGWPGPVTLAGPAGAVRLAPLETVSNSEAGLERTFQGLTCLVAWPLELDPGAHAEFLLTCSLGS